jgi:hypothetical protein
MLERNGKVREFKPSAKGKWDVFVSSAIQMSVGNQIRVPAGFREGKNAFKNNDIAEVREITNTELVLHDGLVYRLLNPLGFVAFKMGRRQGARRAHI